MAVVTGAARGIGAAAAERLAADGFDVVRLDVTAGDGVLACDVADPRAVADTAALVEREHGPVTVLVNNAAIWRFAALEDVASEDFAAVLDVNVRGTFHCTQAFGRAMLARGGGCIVNVVSIAAAAANPSVGAYSASKAGVLALTRQTALEWGPRGVRANAVGPGLVPTPGTGTVYDDPEVRRVRAGAVPLRRLGTSADVAGVIAFLASDAAAYVNGQVLYVDGGLSQALMTLLPRPAGVAGPQLAAPGPPTAVPVSGAVSGAVAVAVVERHLAAVAAGDPVAMAADYAPDAVLERPGARFERRGAIAAYFATVPGRLGGGVVVAAPPAQTATGSVVVRWRLDGGPGHGVTGTDEYRVGAQGIVHQRVQLDRSDF